MNSARLAEVAQDDLLTRLLRQAGEDSNRRECLESFSSYVQEAWALIDPAPLQWSWFLEVLCNACQRWARGEGKKNLAIAMPPGFGKSLVASVFLPTWIWSQDPSLQFLCCSNSQALATRDNLKARSLMRSDWYRDSFIRGDWEFSKDQDQKAQYINTVGGKRQAFGAKSSKIGWRGDYMIFDDLVDPNPQKPPRRIDYELAYDAMKYVRTSRINNPVRFKSLLIMQRLDPQDPFGRVLSEEGEDWDVVCFDFEYDERMEHRHPRDPRTRRGQLLDANRFSPEDVQRNRRLGSTTYNAQYQQQPMSESATIIRPDWIVEYAEDPQHLSLSSYDYIIGSWDCAFLAKSTSSWVVGTIWGVKSPTNPEHRRFDLLHVYREHLTYTQTRAAIKKASFEWPEQSFVIVESKALGPAIMDDLRGVVPNMVPFDPQPYGDKENRMRAIAPIWEMGQIRIHKYAQWRHIYEKEITQFPRVDADDQVDSTTQAVLGSIYHIDQWKRMTGIRRPLVLGWEH